MVGTLNRRRILALAIVVLFVTSGAYAISSVSSQGSPARSPNAGLRTFVSPFVQSANSGGTGSITITVTSGDYLYVAQYDPTSMGGAGPGDGPNDSQGNAYLLIQYNNNNVATADESVYQAYVSSSSSDIITAGGGSSNTLIAIETSYALGNYFYWGDDQTSANMGYAANSAFPALALLISSDASSGGCPTSGGSSWQVNCDYTSSYGIYTSVWEQNVSAGTSPELSMNATGAGDIDGSFIFVEIELPAVGPVIVSSQGNDGSNLTSEISLATTAGDTVIIIETCQGATGGGPPTGSIGDNQGDHFTSIASFLISSFTWQVTMHWYMNQTFWETTATHTGITNFFSSTTYYNVNMFGYDFGSGVYVSVGPVATFNATGVQPSLTETSTSTVNDLMVAAYWAMNWHGGYGKANATMTASGWNTDPLSTGGFYGTELGDVNRYATGSSTSVTLYSGTGLSPDYGSALGAMIDVSYTPSYSGPTILSEGSNSNSNTTAKIDLSTSAGDNLVVIVASSSNAGSTAVYPSNFVSDNRGDVFDVINERTTHPKFSNYGTGGWTDQNETVWNATASFTGTTVIYTSCSTTSNSCFAPTLAYDVGPNYVTTGSAAEQNSRGTYASPLPPILTEQATSNGNSLMIATYTADGLGSAISNFTVSIPGWTAAGLSTLGRTINSGGFSYDSTTAGVTTATLAAPTGGYSPIVGVMLSVSNGWARPSYASIPTIRSEANATLNTTQYGSFSLVTTTGDTIVVIAQNFNSSAYVMNGASNLAFATFLKVRDNQGDTFTQISNYRASIIYEWSSGNYYAAPYNQTVWTTTATHTGLTTIYAWTYFNSGNTFIATAGYDVGPHIVRVANNNYTNASSYAVEPYLDLGGTVGANNLLIGEYGTYTGGIGFISANATGWINDTLGTDGTYTWIGGVDAPTLTPGTASVNITGSITGMGSIEMMGVLLNVSPMAPAPLSSVPPAPTGLLSYRSSTTWTDLSWVAPPGGGLLNYTIYDNTVSGGCSGTLSANSLGGTGTTYNLTGLSSGTAYCIEVRAWNATGQGPGDWINVTTPGSTSTRTVGYYEKTFALSGFDPLTGYTVSNGGRDTQLPVLSSDSGQPSGVYYITNSSTLNITYLASGTSHAIAHVVPLYSLFGYEGMLDNDFYVEYGYPIAMMFGTVTSGGSHYSLELVNLTTGTLLMWNTTAATDGSNQQAQYVGNNTIIVMSSNGSVYGYNLLAHTQWLAGTLGYLEANNAYWIPQKSQIINVHAQGATNDHVAQYNGSINGLGHIMFTLSTTITVGTGSQRFNFVYGLAYNVSQNRIAFSAGYFGGANAETYVLRYNSSGLITTVGSVSYSADPATGRLLEIQRYAYTGSYDMGQGQTGTYLPGGVQYIFDPWNGSVAYTNRSFNHYTGCDNGCFEAQYAPNIDYLLDFNATLAIHSAGKFYSVVYAYENLSNPYPGVPPAPTGLKAVTVSTSQINLSWVNPGGNSPFLANNSSAGNQYFRINTTAGNTLYLFDFGNYCYFNPTDSQSNNWVCLANHYGPSGTLLNTTASATGSDNINLIGGSAFGIAISVQSGTMGESLANGYVVSGQSVSPSPLSVNALGVFAIEQMGGATCASPTSPAWLIGCYFNPTYGWGEGLYAQNVSAFSSPTLAGTGGSGSPFMLWTEIPAQSGPDNLTDTHVYLYSGSSCSGSPTVHDVGSVINTYPYTGLSAATTYSFQVSASNSTGEGHLSACADNTTFSGAMVPAAPTGLVAISGNSDDDIILSWTNPGGGGLTATTIYAFHTGSCSGAAFTFISLGVVTAKDWYGGFSPGTYYGFKVTASNSSGKAFRARAPRRRPCSPLPPR